MKTIDNEFSKLINLSNNLIVSKDHFEFDLDDPLVLNAIEGIEDEDTIICREGFYINLNDNDLGISLRVYFEQIDSFIDEIKDNLNATINEQEKVVYLKRIKKEIEEIETSIEEKNKYYLPNKLSFKNTKVTDLEKNEIENISNHFLVRKKKLRSLLRFIQLQANELNPLQELSDKNISQMDNKKIQLADDINLLVTLFYDLHEKRYIKTSRENLAKFIVNNFVDKNRIALSKSTVDTILKPNKEDKRKTLDKRIIIPDK